MHLLPGVHWNEQATRFGLLRGAPEARFPDNIFRPASWKVQKCETGSRGCWVDTSTDPRGALKREWKRATTREKNEFVAWTKGRKTASAAPSMPIIDAAGHLKPAVIRFIRGWTSDKRITPGRVMKEMGFNNFDYTLSHALKRGAPIRSVVIAPLESWLVLKGFKST
jgi:hypothetical protein